MPTVAILTTLFFPNGVKDAPIVNSGGDRYLIDLAKMFKSKGWEVVIMQSGDSSWETEYEGINIIGIPGTAFEYETNPQLNRVFNEMALSADLRIYFAPFCCFPHVISPCISVCHGIYWDYPAQPYINNTKDIRDEYLRRVRFNMSAADMMVSVDTNSINWVRATWPGEEKRMIYIPNYADTDVFYPREMAKEWDRPRVLYPRRLTTLRGSNELLWAVKQLPDVDFYIVGHSDDPSDGDRMGEICKSHHNLKWMKKKPEDMPEVYRNVDIAVIPTRACEGTSLSCIEAMASGLPIISTVVGGLTDLVIDGYNGYLIDLNHNRLHDAINYMVNHDHSLLGLRGAEMVRSSFNKRLWESKWWTVVQKVIRR